MGLEVLRIPLRIYKVGLSLTAQMENLIHGLLDVPRSYIPRN